MSNCTLSEKDLEVFESQVFPNEGISVNSKNAKAIQELKYKSFWYKRNESGAVDSLVIILWINKEVERWLTNSNMPKNIYDLPESLLYGLEKKSDIIWIDLIAGVSKKGKIYAVRKAVDFLNSENYDKAYAYTITNEGEIISNRLGFEKINEFGLFLRKKK